MAESSRGQLPSVNFARIEYMKLLFAATLAALTFGAGAQASQGSNQLASSLGVEPGKYSLSQLARLKALRNDGNNQYQIKEIVDNPEGPQGNLRTGHRNAFDPNSPGWNNLALSLGVEPGRYSPQQLVALKSAKADKDQGRIAFIMAGGHPETSTSEVSAGTVQLALSLGLEPGLYSLNQLVQIKGYIKNGERMNSSFRIRQILENPAF